MKDNLKRGIIKFTDILGDKGKKYDKWLDKQPEGYYLTYKYNMYSDEYDYSIERYDCISEPIFLTNDISDITRTIDKELITKDCYRNSCSER